MLTATRPSGPTDGLDQLFLLPDRVLRMDSVQLRQDLASLDFAQPHLLENAGRGTVWLSGAAPVENSSALQPPPSPSPNQQQPTSTQSSRQVCQSNARNQKGAAPKESNRDREERLRLIKEKQTEERQRKLEELKQQALAAQKFREQKEEERRRRVEDMRSKDLERRHQVEERKRQIWEAERERREAILRKNMEREARIDTRRKNERSHIVFAFGSSTPRMLEAPDPAVGTFWGTRRATSTTNVMALGAPRLTRRSSERELDAGAGKKRATSAHGLDRKPGEDMRMSTSMYEVFQWTDSPSAPTNTKPQSTSKSKKKLQASRSLPSARLSLPPEPSLLVAPQPAPILTPAPPPASVVLVRSTEVASTTPRDLPIQSPVHEVSAPRSMSLSYSPSPRNARYASVLTGSGCIPGEEGSEKFFIPPTCGRRKTDLMPTVPSPRDGAGSASSVNRPRHKSPGLRSGDVTPSSPSRPLSALSQQSATSSHSSAVSLRVRPSSARKPRPISIAVTGVNLANTAHASANNVPESSPREGRASTRTTTASGSKSPRARSVGAQDREALKPALPKTTPSTKRTPAQVKAENAKRVAEKTARTPKMTPKSTPKDTPLQSPAVEISPPIPKEPLEAKEKESDNDKPAAHPDEERVDVESKTEVTRSEIATEELKPENESQSNGPDTALASLASSEIEVISPVPAAAPEETSSQDVEPEIPVPPIEAQDSVPVVESQTSALAEPPQEQESAVKPNEEEANKKSSEDPKASEDMGDGSAKTRINTEQEAKAALAEKRRLAREQAEKEAELERLRLEEEMQLEEERLRREEEEQRKAEEEQLRLLEEARKAEEERLERAIEEAKRHEEEEKLKREEEAKQKAEREEAEKKAREEAEKQRKEMAEKLRKEEEERQARRKRVEAIMSRTRGKGATPATTPTKSQDAQETNTTLSEVKSSLTENMGQEGTQTSEAQQSYDSQDFAPEDPDKSTNKESVEHKVQTNGIQKSAESEMMSETSLMETSDDLISSAPPTLALPQQNGHRNGLNESEVDLVSVDNVQQNNTTNNLLDFGSFDPFSQPLHQPSSQAVVTSSDFDQILDLGTAPVTGKLSNEDSVNSNLPINGPAAPFIAFEDGLSKKQDTSSVSDFLS